MSKYVIGKVQCVYGAHRQGISKAGKPYNFIELSDGFKAELFNTNLADDRTNHLVYGDELEVELQIDPFTNRKLVTDIL